MREHRRQGKPFVRRGGIWWLATIVCLLLAVIALTGQGGAMRTLRLRSLLADLQAEVAALDGENRALRIEAASLKRESPESIERRAREDLGMIRPGELRIDFREPGTPQAR